VQAPVEQMAQMAAAAADARRLVRPFAHDWAAVLTTYRRDGTSVGTPINLAVEGEHGYFRTSARTHKVKRIRRNPTGQLAPCAPNGRVRGAAIPCNIRVLGGAEAAHAARAITRKHPIVQDVLVSVLQTITRDPGAYFEVTPRVL
jgi:PPOX class probable F420-dependent enzyme